MIRRYFIACLILALGGLAAYGTYNAVLRSDQARALSEIERIPDPAQREAAAETVALAARVPLLAACVLWLILALAITLTYSD